MEAFLLAVGVALGLGWTAWSRLRSRQRADQIPVMAAAKGLHFAAEDPFGSGALDFPLFHRGEKSRLENVVWSDADAGPGGTRARVFDFGWYQSGQTDGTNDGWHWFDCALAQLDASWPLLQVVHQGLMEKAVDLFTGDPIRFESEEFNRTFHVACEDRRFASALIDPQMMQFLLETRGMVSFATLGGSALLTSPRVAPDEMPILLGLANEFVRRVPSAARELYPATNSDPPPGGGWTGTTGDAPPDRIG